MREQLEAETKILMAIAYLTASHITLTLVKDKFADLLKAKAEELILSQHENNIWHITNIAKSILDEINLYYRGRK